MWVNIMDQTLLNQNASQYNPNMQQKSLTAKAWILMDAKKRTYLRGSNTQEKRQIASLTKMYTLYSCLSLNAIFNINPDRLAVHIFATPISGTLARLVQNQFITLTDLYYALMLPSGNDAASLLACYYGSWLLSGDNLPVKSKLGLRKESLGERVKYLELYSKKFVQFMNKVIVKEKLRHSNTRFENAHGLPDKNQFSTVWELAQACMLFMGNLVFAKICSSAYYQGRYVDSDLEFQWYNTNVLLNEGYFGIKTGITTTAGGCLASIKDLWPYKYQKMTLLVVVLNCQNEAARFSDTRQIVQDYMRYLQMMRP